MGIASSGSGSIAQVEQPRSSSILELPQESESFGVGGLKHEQYQESVAMAEKEVSEVHDAQMEMGGPDRKSVV
jgi:hypothetical protein